uniref:CHK kinase-like domain-containing protein n=1 Tax=Panagrolaimus davidi TaxID=227884 RepID=A0A914QSA3_9BILA
MKYPWMTEEKLQMLYKTVEMDEYEKLCMGNSIQNKLPFVLCHNDFWAGNLLFADDGSLVTILDWQTAFFASPTQDLAALLALGLPSICRRKNEKEYLQFYFDTFKYYLEKFNVKDDKGYRKLDFKTLEQSYRTSLKVTVFSVITTWENFDKSGDNGGESENCIQYLLEDID